MTHTPADLPVIDTCDGCGACCLEQGSPPGYLMLLNAPPDGAETVFAEDVERVRQLPPAALRILRDYERGVMSGVLDGDDPCVWLDMTTKRCRFYEHRPSICRALERGGESCRAWREAYDVGDG